MVGDINAPRVIIVDGAHFRGRIDMGKVELERPALARPGGRPVLLPSTPAPRATAKKEERKREGG